MLTAVQGERIREHQACELARLTDDRGYARAAAMTPFYGRIGEWLPEDLGGRVLELGCGPGRFVALLAQLGYQVVGVDPLVFPTWGRIVEKLGVDLRAGISAEALPFEDSSFDHVACMGALLYFENEAEALRELCRVVKPGGRVVVRTVNKGNLYTRRTGRKLDPASHNLYTGEELHHRLERAGFAVERSFTYGFWLPIFPNYWWYLTNGRLPLRLQDLLSDITPPSSRTTITVFARRSE